MIAGQVVRFHGYLIHEAQATRPCANARHEG